MNAYELADLSALVAVHGQQLLAADAATMDRALGTYWKASRCRLDRWFRNLRVLARRGDRSEWSPSATGLIEEILVSEILSRAVAAIAVGHDERHSQDESAPVGRNIFNGHLDARRRALAVVATLAMGYRDGQPLPADALLALHRQCDRWSDLLLAYLTPYVEVDEFAASPARVRDFAYDARSQLQSGQSSEMAVTMILAGMRTSLKALTRLRTPNADLNREIATAILGGFCPEFFDSHGLLQSAWMERLRKVPNETLAQLDEWWRPAKSPNRLPVRWRR
jgi:hypothetical protein